MAAKPVRFHPEAEREYLSSLAWYAERSPAAALDFEGEFQRAVSAVADAPERWPLYLSRCRRYVLRQFPFSIVYRVLEVEAGIGRSACPSQAWLLEKAAEAMTSEIMTRFRFRVL